MNIMGFQDRNPTLSELSAMQNMMHEAMTDGAVGMSTGLTYPPGMFASDEEIVALCSVIKPYGGFYCTHHRSLGRPCGAQRADSSPRGHLAAHW